MAVQDMEKGFGQISNHPGHNETGTEIPACRYVVYDNGTARNSVALAGAGAAPDGVTLFAIPDGEERAVNIFGPVEKVEAGAAVAKAANVTPDATGRAVTAGVGDVVRGKCLVPASAAGEFIYVLQQITTPEPA